MVTCKQCKKKKTPTIWRLTPGNLLPGLTSAKDIYLERITTTMIEVSVMALLSYYKFQHLNNEFHIKCQWVSADPQYGIWRLKYM